MCTNRFPPIFHSRFVCSRRKVSRPDVYRMFIIKTCVCVVWGCAFISAETDFRTHAIIRHRVYAISSLNNKIFSLNTNVITCTVAREVWSAVFCEITEGKTKDVRSSDGKRYVASSDQENILKHVCADFYFSPWNLKII